MRMGNATYLKVGGYHEVSWKLLQCARYEMYFLQSHISEKCQNYNEIHLTHLLIFYLIVPGSCSPKSNLTPQKSVISVSVLVPLGNLAQSPLCLWQVGLGLGPTCYGTPQRSLSHHIVALPTSAFAWVLGSHTQELILRNVERFYFPSHSLASYFKCIFSCKIMTYVALAGLEFPKPGRINLNF